MAAANRPTAVHFSLVFFVMVSLILGVTTYLGFKKYFEQQALTTAADQGLQDQKREYDALNAEVTATKDLLGFQYDQLGGAADASGTVNGAMAAALQALGKSEAGNTAKATLENMATRRDALIAENDTLKKELADNQARLLALERNAQGRVDEHQASQQSSEQQLQNMVAAHEQELNEKNGEIDQWKKDYNLVQSEKEEIRDQFERFQRDAESRRLLLEKQIDYHRALLEEVTQTTFEVEDGHIVSVDNTTRTVWIDLGTLDNLRPQVSFSVYSTDHRGIGRGAEDIKAKIEVTRILDGHLAEARILEEDLFRPIADGDPIFSPLWSAGRTEYFAIVGRPDLDEDGDSDWELFYEIVENAGARVDLIVNDEGLREPFDAKLSARTKFLIIGDIDDPSEYSGQPDKQQLIERIMEEQVHLEDEARLYGIRVVRLNDFLEYMGWKPQQRLWQPGEDREFNLQSGSQSAGVEEGYQDRSSSGQVSELFRQNRARVQKESEGTTSGLFRND